MANATRNLFTLILFFNIFVLILGSPINTAIDPTAPGASNIGTKSSKQFITGQCTSDADCASGCCGFYTGKCAGAVIAQTRDGGCGFGDATPNDNAARILRGQASATAAVVAANTMPAKAAAATPAIGGGTTAQAIDQNAPGAANVGNKSGKQFITGQCTSDADCASGCCGFKSGKCAGAIIAQTRDGGCGFGDATPNDKAAQALRSGGGVTGVPAAAAAQASTMATVVQAAAGAATAAAPVGTQVIDQNAPGAANVGNKAGKQFITGQCTSDADCASGCCGFKSGKCAGAIIAQTRDGGCGFGNATPNDTAAQKLRGQA